MAKGLRRFLRAQRSVTLLRGRLDGLEVTLSGRDLEEAFGELEARLARQPSFYQGARAIASFGATVPAAHDLARLRGLLSQAGVTLRALCGTGEGLEALAAAEGLQFEAPPTTGLSKSAQSLVADFAGARTDIAQRRKRGEASVRRPKFETQPRPHPELRLVEALPTTLYHAATLRGGQALHHTGNIVVVGDVNPGAELIATGDVLVFGRLAGTAHAGAQGDEAAHIYALDLAATQLRIATFIAVEDSARPSVGRGPEAALVRAGQIVILPLNGLSEYNDVRSSLS